jgi:hypothetical protein
MMKTYHANFARSITCDVIDLGTGADHLGDNRISTIICPPRQKGELP